MAQSSDSIVQTAIGFHQQGYLDKADRLYSKVLSRDSCHVEAMHMRGVLKLQLNKHEHAKQLLGKAAKLAPANALISFHQGELYQSLEDFKTAEDYFLKALSLGADDADVYFMLGNALFDQSRFAEAADSYRAAIQRSPNDWDCRLNLANALEALGELEQAIEHLTLLAKQKNTASAIKLQLVSVLARNSDFAHAEHCIQGLTVFVASDAKPLIQAIKTLTDADRSELASRLLDYALTQTVFNPSNVNLDANLFEQLTGLMINLGRYQAARPFIESRSPASLLATKQESAITLFQRGLCEQVAGDFEQATQSHRQALSVDTTLGRAAYSLAANGRSNITEDELVSWQRQVDNKQLSDEQRAQFLFSIARVRDEQKHFDMAFAAYSNANRIHAEDNPFDPDAWDRYIDGIIKNFSAEYFERIKGMGQGGDELVFIVGMPRSGSTLLEHNLVQTMGAYGLGEHPTVRRLFMDLPTITSQQLPAPECAKFIEQMQSDYMREQYSQSLPVVSVVNTLSNASIIEGESLTFYVDKMLGNFLRLGIIAAMYPNAKILHSSRDSCACCVSCYTNLFARGLRFTYDLYWLGRAWKSYDRLMKHWQAVLPLQMYEVCYESVVADPELAFSDVASFLGKKYSPDTTLNQAAGSDINTASFFQARQAISTSSLDAWKRFDANLEPLHRGLA